jgi:DNA-binding transcriptional LysR family regulator
MNRAAAELHMVQSNVTARIRALEEQIGTALFERNSRGVVLTAAGERLLPYVARLNALLKEAAVAARDDGTPRGTLRVGSLETTAALRLPSILSAYSRTYPEVGLIVTTGTSAELVADVLEHRLDGAFVCGPVQHPDLAEEVIFHEELMLVTAPRVRRLDDLDRERDLKVIVFRRGCSYRQRLEDLLARRGIQTVQPMEFASLEAIIGCVAAGVGITLLPKAVIMSARREGRIAAHKLPPDQARVDTMFIRCSQGHVSSALSAFMAAARPRSAELTAAE